MTDRMWSLSFSASRSVAETCADALEDDAVSVSLFEQETGKPDLWCVDALFMQPPDRDALYARLTQSGLTQSDSVEFAELDEKDWVAETLTSFAPFRVGRFWVYGSHASESPPPGSLPLCVNATTAFGTGEHATTAGCLLAIDHLSKRASFRRVIARSGKTPVLDVGCGTGILALAAARVWPGRVLATDIDAEAVRVARATVAANGLSGRVSVADADGIGHRAISHAKPYALVTANILARPLRALASDLSSLLGPGGRIVLSGLLQTQRAMVLSAYRGQGLRLEREFPLAEWSTLVLRR